MNKDKLIKFAIENAGRRCSVDFGENERVNGIIAGHYKSDGAILIQFDDSYSNKRRNQKYTIQDLKHLRIELFDCALDNKHYRYITNTDAVAILPSKDELSHLIKVLEL